MQNENPHLLAASVKSSIHSDYRTHMKIYTDGPVLDNTQSGAAFITPALKVEKSYYIQSSLLNWLTFSWHCITYLISQVHFFQVLVCVDSKSVLNALESLNMRVRAEIVLGTSHSIHFLAVRGTIIDFCWIVSHCGIFHNELVDRAAKIGVHKLGQLIKVTIPLSRSTCRI